MFFTVNKQPTYQYQMMPKSKNTMVYTNMTEMYTAPAVSTYTQNDKAEKIHENTQLNIPNVQPIGSRKISVGEVPSPKRGLKPYATQQPVQQNSISSNAPILREVDEPPKPKPMRWGQPTWFLFHTMAEKIKEEYFNEYRVEILKTIYLICTALPCPECTKHATEYMNNINFSTIRTKEDLKLMLFAFHNVVNQRKKYDIFKLEDLAQYEKANTLRIVQYFMVHYSPNKGNGSRVDINRYYRQNVAEKLTQWFNQNLAVFDK